MADWTPTLEQRSGAEAMARGEKPLVFDKPGTGKTPMAILACDLAGARHILVLSPAAVRGHWRREFAEKQKIDRQVHSGVSATLRTSQPIQGVTVVSHDFMARLEGAAWLLSGAPWDAIIVDEAHAMANIAAQRTIRLLGWQPDALWRQAGLIWALTGTPMINSAADLYPLVQSVIGARTGYLPIWLDFIREFTHVRIDDRGNEVPIGVKNVSGLREIVHPFMLRRSAAAETVPPMDVTWRPIDVADSDVARAMGGMTGADPALVEAQLEAGIEPSGELVTKVRHALGIAKAPHVVRRLLAEYYGFPYVVFYAHTAVRDLITAALVHQMIGVASVDGEQTEGQRQAIVDAFQAGQIDVLLVQERAGGVGLTLTRSNRPVVAEVPWTTVALAQAFARCHRVTQTRLVQAEVLWGQRCWLEAVLQKVIARKERAAWEVLDA